MLNIPYYNVSQNEHRLRQEAHLKSGQELMKSIIEFEGNITKNFHVRLPLPGESCMASDPKWEIKPYGAVCTVKSACIPFVARQILNLPAFKKYYDEVSMEDIIDEFVKKGYLMWKVKNFKKTFNTPFPTLEVLHKAFPDNESIQNSNSLEEIFKITGKPVNVGESIYFIDYLTATASSRPLRIGTDTRIHTIEQLIWNLINGIPVPVRVSNIVYHNDITREGGHYITIYGFENNRAIIVDTSLKTNNGVNTIPVNQLFTAMIAKENCICAWNCKI